MKTFDDVKRELAEINGFSEWDEMLRQKTDSYRINMLERAGSMLADYYAETFKSPAEKPIPKSDKKITWKELHTPPAPDLFVVCINEIEKTVGIDCKTTARGHFKGEWTHWVYLPQETTGWDFRLPEGLVISRTTSPFGRGDAAYSIYKNDEKLKEEA